MNKTVICTLLGLCMTIVTDISACGEMLHEWGSLTSRKQEAFIRTCRTISESMGAPVSMGSIEQACLVDMSTKLWDMVTRDDKIAEQIEGILRPIAFETMPIAYGKLLYYQEEVYPKDVLGLSDELIMSKPEILRERHRIARRLVRGMQQDLSFAQKCWFRIFDNLKMLDKNDWYGEFYKDDYALLRRWISRGNMIFARAEEHMNTLVAIFDINEGAVYYSARINEYLMPCLMRKHSLVDFYLCCQTIKVVYDKKYEVPQDNPEIMEIALSHFIHQCESSHGISREDIAQDLGGIIYLSRYGLLEIFDVGLTRKLFSWDPILADYTLETGRIFGDELVPVEQIGIDTDRLADFAEEESSDEE